MVLIWLQGDNKKNWTAQTTACCLLSRTLKKWFLPNLFNLLPLFVACTSRFFLPLSSFRPSKQQKRNVLNREMEECLKRNLKLDERWDVDGQEEITIIPQKMKHNKRLQIKFIYSGSWFGFLRFVFAVSRCSGKELSVKNVTFFRGRAEVLSSD